MNLELFIAKRIHFSKEKGEKRTSSPAIKIAIAGVAIGLAAMILALSIVVGFKKEVRNKVVGFGAHIQITNLHNNSSYETLPICISPELRTQLESTEGIQHLQAFSTKPGIIKTDSAFQGIILKGVGEDYDWDFFKKNMIEGAVINRNDTTISNQVILSKNIASKLNLKTGDSFLCYFVGENVRYRKFNITGIYSTNFEDYDKLFVITDIELIRRLNSWDDDEASGVELLVTDYDNLDKIQQNVFLEMMSYRDRKENTLLTRSIKELNPMIFGWLDLLDTNVVVIIVLMFLISIFTMIAGLLIIILERTNMIGMLKTLGARNYNIRKVFLYVSSFLILKGMLWGNVIALALLFIQKYFGVIKLDAEKYYMSEVPVDINFLYIILINVGTLVLSMLVMIIPSYLIAKISPAKSIRYE
ncbi:lipoprotein-releasing system permease protein [Dysgonomonas sp. PFB1-18]|uniref:ABC transporter permease n=1 Tax=unclassified Dysgonomonas TaxID=2630389 RepID=UPI002476C678|nr:MULTISPECIES: FtsX-like permease family protein [unclassified Dysgonomonas]MDH6310091.1 lipoprotein-releasing system permease protein [Dysgonomonas sp. PF1-14]MDH6340243.1 lipoprotein-releasing system permease protein [Dysgonomonas sp. PF1-16]MDH6381648.1 lipoprotein-releasing system permease protein [Dysgonomonas sp. PFB1-18]MDH6399007.1 lipoprotein-releasing system permease protein [Dysgonomonas sp. PF1-23]